MLGRNLSSRAPQCHHPTAELELDSVPEVERYSPPPSALMQKRPRRILYGGPEQFSDDFLEVIDDEDAAIVDSGAVNVDDMPASQTEALLENLGNLAPAFEEAIEVAHLLNMAPITVPKFECPFLDCRGRVGPWERPESLITHIDRADHQTSPCFPFQHFLQVSWTTT